MQVDLPQIRCGACHRKLGEGHYRTLVIKCPRCGVLNQLKASEPLFQNAVERQEPVDG
ncbi:MAG: Com family DNA-binding transcriptional regulator [Laribacter sp.]|nr:Com family DNA-binding transcriptional regulator [Laribacter sp.]MBP9527815.1 Com family DNA-binding transcriptional regulator [Laribacter sp.]MBP9608958.1 Com family DNA-binding transcriptional regulator [Laribacter sp.]